MLSVDCEKKLSLQSLSLPDNTFPISTDVSMNISNPCDEPELVCPSGTT